MADGFTIKQRGDLETMEGSGESTWRLVRRGIECPAFGINLVTIGPGGQIPEHDESSSGQHEVFTIIEGDGVMVLNGEDHPAPAGTFVHMDPSVTRTIRNDSDAPITALLIGGTADGSYQPPEWA